MVNQKILRYLQWLENVQAQRQRVEDLVSSASYAATAGIRLCKQLEQSMLHLAGTINEELDLGSLPVLGFVEAKACVARALDRLTRLIAEYLELDAAQRVLLLEEVGAQLAKVQRMLGKVKPG